MDAEETKKPMNQIEMIDNNDILKTMNSFNQVLKKRLKMPQNEVQIHIQVTKFMLRKQIQMLMSDQCNLADVPISLHKGLGGFNYSEAMAGSGKHDRAESADGARPKKRKKTRGLQEKKIVYRRVREGKTEL